MVQIKLAKVMTKRRKSRSNINETVHENPWGLGDSLLLNTD
mgnify:CR=1 FL=1